MPTSTGMMRHSNDSRCCAAPSDARTVAVTSPTAAVTTPEIVPLLGSIFNDGGRLVAKYVSGSPSGSLATSCRETFAFHALLCDPGLVKTGGSLGRVTNASLDGGPSSPPAS